MNNKIIILANANSIWTKRYIENVIVPLKLNVVLVSYENETFKNYYGSSGIKVKTTKPIFDFILFNNIKSTIVVLKTILIILLENPIIVHIQYLYKYLYNIFSIIKSKRITIVNFWGSDLLRVDEKYYAPIKKIIKSSNYVVVGSENLKEKINELFNDQTINIDFIRFGIPIFKEIDNNINLKESIKNELLGNSANSKIIITVGNNASKEQQHLFVIEAISNIPKNIKDKIFLLLPMSYQNSDYQYVNDVKELLKKINVQYAILDKFMNEYETARLCVLTDIYINSQVSDAISATMLEQLYSGSKIVNGSWLNYDFLNSADIYVYNNFKELTIIISNLINNNTIDSKNDIFKKIIYDEFSIDVVKNKWEILYNNILNAKNRRSL